MTKGELKRVKALANLAERILYANDHVLPNDWFEQTDRTWGDVLESAIKAALKREQRGAKPPKGGGK